MSHEIFIVLCMFNFTTAALQPGESADSLDHYMSVVDKQLDSPTRKALQHQVFELQKVCLCLWRSAYMLARFLQRKAKCLSAQNCFELHCVYVYVQCNVV